MSETLGTRLTTQRKVLALRERDGRTVLRLAWPHARVLSPDIEPSAARASGAKR
jgi:hypothetical protein